MMLIQFSEQVGPWSPIIFWFVTVNAFLTIGFILVVIVGGISDLRFLLKALREESGDMTDDGRVVTQQNPTGAFPVGDAESQHEPPGHIGSA